MNKKTKKVNNTDEVISIMFDKNKLSGDAREYFDSLPKMIQENIIQSGSPISTKEELEKVYTNLTSKTQ